MARTLTQVLPPTRSGRTFLVAASLLGPDGPTGTFTRWEDAAIPW